MMKLYPKLVLAAGLASCVLLAAPAFAQNAQPKQSATANASDDDEDTKNIVKWNIPALLLKNFSFQYERAVGRRTSVALGIRFAPKSSLPFQSQFKSVIDDEEFTDNIDQFKVGNFAITPEFRYYVGKHGVFRGFYLAPFVRYSTYSLRVPDFEYTVTEDNVTETRSVVLTGNMKSFTGGLMIGSQFKLSSQFYLDWWIIGASAGSQSGTLNGYTAEALDQTEQNALREELDKFDSKFINTKVTTNANGADVDIDGPWYTVRAGLAVGFRF